MDLTHGLDFIKCDHLAQLLRSKKSRLTGIEFEVCDRKKLLNWAEIRSWANLTIITLHGNHVYRLGRSISRKV